MYDRAGRLVYSNRSLSPQELATQQQKGAPLLFQHFSVCASPPHQAIMPLMFSSWEPLLNHLRTLTCADLSLWLSPHTPTQDQNNSSEPLSARVAKVKLTYAEGEEWVTLRVSPSAQDLKGLTGEVTYEATLASLERLNQELRQASQAKDDFLASMSHELRTPLNAILGLSEALLESVYGPLSPDQVHSVKQISRGGEHLLALISDILDISKMRAGGLELHLTEVDVEAVCAEVIQQLRADLQRKHLLLSFEMDSKVQLLRADERYMKQALMNLLANAVKFTPEGKRIGIHVRGDAAQHRLKITVWDEGIGVASEDIERLFQPFVQLDSSLAKAYQGTGLGLAIVRSMMELHQGRVWVESTPQQGSSFHLEFPWDQERLVTTPQSAEPLQLDRVLLVEDSPIDADKLKRYLAEINTEVCVDETGGSALEAVRTFHPQVIILDLHLPETTGCELLARLRAHPKSAHLPVVVCSVLEPHEARVPLDQVQGYLVKPISRRSLFKALSQLPPQLINNSASALAAPSQARLGERSLSPQPQATQQTLLIVDDHLANIKLIQDYLTRKGYQLLTAEDGAQAVDVARALQPNLILMDVQMPRMDGIEATRILKADPLTQEIPIFALTALAMAGDKERCLEAGMDDYFTKPVSLRTLAKAISKKLSV
jgi:signal transduction histidine kinase/DNA-binding response OmpR family regulator